MPGRGTHRFSSILVATGDGHDVYTSLDEVPPPLRRKLIASTRGVNSATILIADRNGQQEILRAARGESSALSFRTVPEPEVPARTGMSGWLCTIRVVVEIAVLAGLGAVVWALLTLR